jgi:hypothetical protein
MIYDGTPASVTFAIFSPEMETPTVIIGRNGGVKERKPFLQCIHPKVFVTQPKDYLGITAAQKRTMLKLACRLQSFRKA